MAIGRGAKEAEESALEGSGVVKPIPSQAMQKPNPALSSAAEASTRAFLSNLHQPPCSCYEHISSPIRSFSFERRGVDIWIRVAAIDPWPKRPATVHPITGWSISISALPSPGAILTTYLVHIGRCLYIGARLPTNIFERLVSPLGDLAVPSGGR